MATSTQINTVLDSIVKKSGVTIPEHVRAVLNEHATSGEPRAKKLVNDIFSKLEQHDALLHMDEFKFSALPFMWPTARTANLSTVRSSVFHRSSVDQMLAKDGVALWYIAEDEGQHLSLHMEDLKGRHSILMVAQQPKQELTSHTFSTDNGPIKGHTIDVSQAKWRIIMDAPVAKPLLEKIKQLQPVTIPYDMEFDAEFKDLWFSKPAGIDSTVRNGVLPVPANFASKALHAQINKLDRSILVGLSNGVQTGPTYKRMFREFSSAFEPMTNGGDLVTCVKKVNEALTGMKSTKTQLTGNEQFFKNLLAANASPRDLAVASIRHLSQMSSFFKPDANIDKRRHKAIKLPSAGQVEASKNTVDKKVSTSKVAPIRPDASAPSTGNSMQAVFEQYHEDLSVEQLTQQLVKAAVPGKLIPLTPHDISTLEGIVQTMKQVPARAEHGMVWVSTLLNDKLIEANKPQPSQAQESQEVEPEISLQKRRP